MKGIPLLLLPGNLRPTSISMSMMLIINHMNMMYRKNIERATQAQNMCEGLFRKRKGKIKMKIGRKHILLRKKEIETK